MALQQATFALLFGVVLALGWVILELRKLNGTISPILGSSFGQALASV